ncbi:hypothetical protein V2J09_013390, partial [Rumex salicifolius]
SAYHPPFPPFLNKINSSASFLSYNLPLRLFPSSAPSSEVPAKSFEQQKLQPGRRPECPPGIYFPTPMTISGCSNMELREDQFPTSSMFRTASVASLPPKQSSISRASAVLGDESDSGTESGRQRDVCGSYNSLFQTASGKKVRASSAALARAKALLGHDELNDDPSFQSIKGDTTYENTHSKKTWDGANTAGTSLGATSAPHKSFVGPQMPNTTSSSTVKAPPIKFHTAGGRSISVSVDALKRAKSLLGDLEQETSSSDKVDECDALYPVLRERDTNVDYVNQDSDVNCFHNLKNVRGRKQDPKSFSTSLQTPSARNHFTSISRGKLSAHESHTLISSVQNVPYGKHCVSASAKPTTIASRVSSLKTSSREALVPTATNVGANHVSGKQSTGDLKRTGTKNRVSSFKRPRTYKFTNPMNNSIASVPSGLSNESRENSCYNKRVSTRYPAPNTRIYIKDFFKVPSTPPLNMILSDEVRQLNPGNAEKYVFSEVTGLDCTGVEAIHRKLAHSGASLQYATKEWVANHYKWIVWKLACYERLSSTKFTGTFLSVSNVLEELKYRYEREVNYGHRSAIKKILEGDASPSSVLILCISAIFPNNNVEVETEPVTVNENERRAACMIELTDGWYSINARLDVVLSEFLALGKLFVGQKLRIWGACLGGWIQPVSPLQAPSTINLQLHGNGTYRACWADRLGFARDPCMPLAFTHIRSSGGPVPRVLVGVKRIYPVLYKERLGNEVCIVRSEKAEAEVLRLYNLRCSNIIEGVMSDFCTGDHGSGCTSDHDSEDGAKLLKMLETIFEPEVLMAAMSTEQLASVSNYQAKLESRRQLEIEKSVKKALEDAGLSSREVTPFMRLRVVGLTNEGGRTGKGPKEGLLTIWNPTEKQQLELVEGQAYSMLGLVPLHSNSSTLFLHSRGSTLNWKPLTSMERECFESFFSPRESVLLSTLGNVPISSEFDTATLVLYVGKEYVTAHQKRQWVFVTDGSTSEPEKNEPYSISLLAISFCSPYSDAYSVSPVNHNLAGSIVGFSNLIKRSRDETNDLWVAEATENTTYHLNYECTRFSHLNHAYASVQKWTDRSSAIIVKLREKVLFIAGDS